MSRHEALPKLLADWNKLDAVGRVILSAKRGPRFDPVDFARFEGRPVLLLDPPAMVEAIVERDEKGRWVGMVEWGTRVAIDGRGTS